MTGGSVPSVPVTFVRIVTPATFIRPAVVAASARSAFFSGCRPASPLEETCVPLPVKERRFPASRMTARSNHSHAFLEAGLASIAMRDR